MTSVSPFKKNRRSMAFKYALGCALVGSLGAAYAFKAVFARPGEASFRLIPADAMFAGSFDFTPSPSQVIAFKHIDDSLSRDSLDKTISTSAILGMIGKPGPALDALTPLILRNGSVAVLKNPKANPKDEDGSTGVVLMLAVSDPALAQTTLKKYGQPSFWHGTKFYSMWQRNTSAMVLDDLLILGDKPWTMHQIAAVQSGDLKSIGTDPAFLTAKSRVSDDANVKLFLNPSVMADSGVAALQNAHTGWTALGLAIRDGGIGVSVSGQADPDSMPALAAYSKTLPIRPDLYKVLPSGAYGIVTVSQPSNILVSVEKAIGEEKGGAKDVQKFEQDINDQSGISVKDDILPGMQGDFVLAAYPRGAEAKNIDALAVMDDSNGADPSNAVEKLKKFIDEQSAKESKGETFFTEKDSNGLKVFTLTDHAKSDLQKSLGDSVGKTMKNDAFSTTTVTWALVGKALMVSSNQDLLNRAIAAYGGHTGTLADDPNFSSSAPTVLDGSQNAIVLSVARIAQGIKNSVDTSSADPQGRKMINGLLDAFSQLKDPFTLQSKISPDGSVAGGTFIPLDYDKVIDVVSDAMKSNDSTKHS